MSEFASETSQAAQEEVEHVRAGTDRDGTETLGSSTPGDDALQRDPAEWVSGNDPITPAQKSYLDTLARQAGEELPADMTKAEASQQIERLKNQLGLEG
jgi:hypothetical protein